MKFIQISKKLKLPMDVVTQTLGIIARKGAGKSYLAMLIMEGLLDMHAQVVALDPVGNWWGLRLLADGKTRGYDIPVIGGAHGDVPLEPEAGELIADLICGESLSAVIDVSEFYDSERKKFVTAFARKLLKLKREKPSPIHIMLEEAQLFAPQQVRPEDAPMLGAIQKIVRLGRNYGIGTTLISQRPQSINKEVLSQVELLCVLQLIGAHERRAIKEWIVNNATDTQASINDLPNLAIGEAMVWSPQWLQIFERHKIGKKKTFDASATPKFGGKQIEPRRLATKEIASLQSAMAQVIERAADKDPAKLRAKIHGLEIELNKRDKTRPAPDLGIAQKRYNQGFHDALAQSDEVGKINAVKVKSAIKLLEGLADARDSRPTPKKLPETPAVERARTQLSKGVLTRDEAFAKFGGSPPGANGSLRSGAVRIAKVLAGMFPRKVTKSQLATLALFSPRGGTFNTYLSDLKRTGMLIINGSDYLASDLAVSAYGHLEPVPTDTANLTLYWKERLRKGAGEMLDVLVDRGVVEISREGLANAVNMEPSGGTFNTYISDLVRNGLAVRVDGGMIKASDSLFAGV
ncbi:MAG: DUF87 domain-containing protein [Nitrospinae bacterium]|nr:DUF87 domain-containing protein [Nitrospinota bacterium]